jgi:hypothetical protein
MKTDKKWEYMDDISYCKKKIGEVSEKLGHKYSDPIWDFAFKKGYRLDKAKIRNVVQGRERDRMYADIINQYGNQTNI